MPSEKELSADILEKLTDVGKNWEKMKGDMDKYHKEVETLGSASADTTKLVETMNEAITKSQTEITELREELTKEGDLTKRLDTIDAALKRNGGLSVQKGINGVVQSDEAIEYKKSWNDWLKFGLDKREEACGDAFKKMIAGDEVMKNLAVNFEPGAGQFVPIDTSGKISTVIYESSVMRQVCAVQQISTDSLEGPIDEGRASFRWIGETTVPTQTTLPNRGIWSIPTHEAEATVLITQKLIEDSIVDQEAWAIGKIGEEFGLGEELAFVNGDGLGKPRGILTYPAGTLTAGKIPRGTLERILTGVNGGLTNPDVLLNMIYAQKKVYRASSRFAFAREGIQKVRLMRMDDQYVWQPGLQADEPDRLLGYTVEEMNDIPDFATDALVGMFGDFAKTYQIVDRIQMSLLRDPYTNKPFVEIYARKRVGGDVRNFDAMKLLQASAP